MNSAEIMELQHDKCDAKQIKFYVICNEVHKECKYYDTSAS
jgi:hypothetical protein